MKKLNTTCFKSNVCGGRDAGEFSLTSVLESVVRH